MKNKLLITTALVAFAATYGNAYAEHTVIASGEELTVNEGVSNATGEQAGGAFRNFGTLTLNDGLSFTNNDATHAGGVVYNSGKLIVGDNVSFTENSSFLNGENYSGASEMGAAIYSEGTTDSQKVITIGNNANFSNNKAYAGTALYLFGNNAATIGDNAVFDNNQTLSAKDSDTVGGSGGAITIVSSGGNLPDYDNGNAALTIGKNAIFSNNTAKWGGAIDNNKALATLTIGEGAQFINNTANGSVGGAIYSAPGSAINLTSATFTNNTASFGGGAIHSNGTLNLSGTNVFSGNKSNGVLNDIYNAGTITVDGDLTLDGGISGAGTTTFAQGSNLTVNTGTTTITNAVENKGATLHLNLENGFTGDYALITGDGSLDNEFDIAVNNLYAIKASDETKGTYSISKKTADEVSESSGANGNQASVITAVTAEKSDSDSLFGSIAGKLSSLMQSSDQAEVKAALDAATALAPETAPMVQQAQTTVANQVFGAAGTRLSGGSIASSSQGISSGDNLFERAAVWIQGLFNKSKLDSTSKAEGFDAKTNGVALGIEKFVNDDIKLGIGYAYSKTDIDGFLRDTDVDTHTALLYGEYKPSNWYVNGIVTYSWSDYSENKSVAGYGVTSDYDAESFGLQAMTGYVLNTKGVDLTPEAGLRYVHIKQDSYKDSAGQSVSTDDSDILTGVIGIKAGKNFELSNGMWLKPEARIAATYDLTNDDVNSVVTLANGSSYAVEGDALDRFGMEFGAGVSAELNDKVEVSLGYEGKFRDDYQDHTGLLNAKYKF
jgi:outer membrane autotransporter protein